MSAFLAMQHAAHACQHIILVFVGKFRTWYLGLGTNCNVVKPVMSETAMFENVMFATAKFETVMCESVMFDSVMFETVRRARVDCFMNTPLQQLGWVATWNLHNELPREHDADKPLHHLCSFRLGQSY